jgi:hypothetical protein
MDFTTLIKTSCKSFDPVSSPSSKVIVRKNEVSDHLIAIQHHQTLCPTHPPVCSNLEVMNQSKANIYIALSVLSCLHAPRKLHTNNLFL